MRDRDPEVFGAQLATGPAIGAFLMFGGMTTFAARELYDLLLSGELTAHGADYRLATAFFLGVPMTLWAAWATLLVSLRIPGLVIDAKFLRVWFPYPTVMRRDQIAEIIPRRGSVFEIKTSSGRKLKVPLSAYRSGLRAKLLALAPGNPAA